MGRLSKQKLANQANGSRQKRSKSDSGEPYAQPTADAGCGGPDMPPPHAQPTADAGSGGPYMPPPTRMEIDPSYAPPLSHPIAPTLSLS